MGTTADLDRATGLGQTNEPDGTTGPVRAHAPGQPAEQEPEGTDLAAEHLLRIINDAGAGILLSIGYQSGLLDTMGALPPASTQQIADAAGLDERYVREIVHGLLSTGIVEAAGEGAFSLGPAYVPVVTGPGVDNLARMTRYLTLMGEVTPKVVEAVRHGGGLGYEDYPGFHRIQAEESAAVNDASLLSEIIPLTGEVGRLEAGIDVADIGCGQGHAVSLLARAFPASRFVGLDFSPEAIGEARAEAAAWGLGNAKFELADVAELSDESAFDLVTAFDAIHDQARPADVLAAVRRALRPGGTFLMVDIRASSVPAENAELPWAAFLYAISTVHCMSVSLGQGGAGLGTVWGVQRAERMLREAGFGDVELKDLDGDPFNAYVVARP
ncbi:class I SAM-dependent methyltransferase [Sinomonas halotolerans]|uniref:Class I SAM-dependent methyltransferase n=1 Tax=Sinomonas halotolerans TaxID=1644133 RepID=A0ABU9X309_9MICC